MRETTSKVFMAFASGSESTEGTSVKRYIGVAPVFVVAVNPTKAELEKIYNVTLEKDPVYIGTGKVGEKDVAQIRLDFIVKTDPEKSNGIEMTSKASFFLRKEYRYNADKTKVQVIDKYGEFAWPTIEEARAKAIPQYASGPANIDPDYRPAYIGEEELTGFLKAYLNIPVRSYKDKNGVVHTIKNPADAEARLEKVVSYFNGDVSELKGIIALQPNNKVKLSFGVKTTDDGKLYQDVFIQRCLKNAVNDYSRLDADIKDRQNNGAYANTVFSVEPLAEYSVEPTSFSKEEGTPSAPAVADSEWFKA